MRQIRIDPRSRFGLLLSVLFLAISLSVTAGISLAAPSSLAVQRILADLPEQQENIPYCNTPSEDCNKIQVVVMIDQSGSMRTNDPAPRLRFLGAENLVDLLAYRYLEARAAQSYLQDLVAQGVLEAGAAQIITPTIQLAVLHFGSDVLYNSGWKTIDPKSYDDFEGLKTIISPEEPKGGEATNFIRPFEEAKKLLDQASSQDDQGCPRRVILLLTDGAPAGAQKLRGAALKAHMDRVAAIAKDGMSGKGDFIYVTAFNVKDDNYWGETRPFWEKITCPDSADPPCSSDLPRSKRENTPGDVASRMEKIVATHLGYRHKSFPIQEDPVVFDVSAYLQSLRITYYAPTPKASPTPDASFTMVDPDGNTVKPDGENIILTGQGTKIQVLVIKSPKPGRYQISSETGSTITLLPTYLQLTPKIETSPGALQQFTSSEIQLTLLDTSGKPVTRADFPKYQLDLRAEVRQGDQTWPLSRSEDGNSFKAAFLPVSSGPAWVEVTATLRDTQGKECRLIVEPGDELKVAPVTFQVGEMPEKVCAPSQMPVTYPLTLINAETQAPAVISVPVDWKVSSTSPSGHPVEASIDETGSGQYQLSLQTDQAEDIRTSLTASAIITASAEAKGQTYPFFTDVLTTTGLLEDRSLAFELGKPGTVADRWSLFFNRLFRPGIKDYPGQILIGRRLFGWLGPQDVTIIGRFFNQRTGEDETGIQRFYVQLASEGGGPLLEKANSWIPGEGGIYNLLIPAPRLGVYRLNVIDEGESLACTTIGGLPTLNLLLISDFWEYIFWIFLILLALVLLAWLILMLVCRYVNPPWGYLELVEPNGQVPQWTGLFDSGDAEHAVRSCYTWKLDPPIFGIVMIKARSWDQPTHRVRIELRRVDDCQVYCDYLSHRCTYICWEDRPWRDANLENDFRLTWRTGRPGVE